MVQHSKTSNRARLVYSKIRRKNCEIEGFGQVFLMHPFLSQDVSLSSVIMIQSLSLRKINQSQELVQRAILIIIVTIELLDRVRSKW